jgi:hypothetical protein
MTFDVTRISDAGMYNRCMTTMINILVVMRPEAVRELCLVNVCALAGFV